MSNVRLRLLLALWLGSASARAQEPAAIEVTWQSTGAAACAAPDDVPAEIARLAGEAARDAKARFVVQIEALADGRQQLSVAHAGDTGASTRLLGSCAEARETALLIMAMALGPEAAAADGEASAAPAESEAAADPNGDADDSAESAATAQDTPQRWRLGAGLLIDGGTLPKAGVGPWIELGFGYRVFRAAAFLRYLAPRGADGLPDGVAAEIDSFAGGLAGAALFRWAFVALGPCLELELGYLRGRASGVEDPQAERTSWVALLGGVELEAWFLPRLGMKVNLLAGPPFIRPHFAFEASDAFFTPWPVLVRGLVALLLRLDPTD